MYKIRLNGRNPVSLNSFNFVQLFYKLKEVFASSFAKISNIYTGQHNLFRIFRSYLFCPGHNVWDIFVPACSPCKGYGAI